MKTMRFSEVLSLALILNLACNKQDSSTGPGPEGARLVPLAVGNQWTFTDSTFGTSSVSVDSSFLWITGTASIQYQGQTIDVYHWNWLDNRTMVPQHWKWLSRNEADGLYLFGGQSAKGIFQLGKSLSQKYPAAVGDSWQSISYLYRGSDSTFRVGDTLTVHCLSTNEQVVTPAGTFAAQVTTYQRTVTSGSTVTVYDVYLYHVPSVGYIGLTEKQAGKVTYRKLLRAYRIVGG